MSRKCVKANTPDECLRKWREACGIGPVKVRPGSISEFYVLHGHDHLKSRSTNKDTQNRYFSCWETRVGPFFGHLRFDELTPDLVQQGLTQGASGSSQHMDKLVLLGLVRVAIALGWARPEHEYMVKLARLKKLGQRKRTDMAEKADQILAEAERLGSWMEGPIFAASTLGLRKAELCGLKPTDLKNGRLTLSRQRSHRLGERDGLKSGHESRTIGLPATIAARLASYHRPGTVYLFTLPDGRPIPYQHLDRELKRILAGLPEIGHVTIHDFRSAAISRLIRAGASDSQIIEIVGHRSAAHLKHYRDESEARTRETLSTLVPKG